MKSFQCACRQPLFFENTECIKCGAKLGFDPTSSQLVALKPTKPGLWMLVRETRRPQPEFRFCATREQAAHCNWLIPEADPDQHCVSCRLTRTIPNLARPKNPTRLRDIESAKRRVFCDLLGLDLPLAPKTDDHPEGLLFDLLEPIPGDPPVLTGHDNGLITLNVAEADDDYREKFRENLGEPYRTLVGHLRHELAHYYWGVLIRDTNWLPKFRDVFGSEETDYAAALRHHYANGAPEDWRNRFISAYAAAHPWEDWAESFAHFLHLRATLETATSYRLSTTNVPLRIDPFGPDSLYEREPAEAGAAFLGWINAWVVLTAVLNEVARSMGQPDIYPFVMNGPVVRKLHFVHCVLRGDPAIKPVEPPALLATPSVD